MTDQTSKTPLQDAFEEWFCSGYRKLERAPGGYSLMSAQSAWVAWQAGVEWAKKTGESAMTEKKMLEFAAKAAGYQVARIADDGESLLLVGVQEPWNPRRYDGDALRLA